MNRQLSRGKLNARRLPLNEIKFAGVISATDLMALELPSTPGIVSGLIPQGLTLLAGPVKLGKSWLSLEIASAVAMPEQTVLGIFRPVHGEALVLALEDTPRRLQNRLRLILDGKPAPAGLHFVTEFPALKEGALDRLDAFAVAHPRLRLVIIDTLGKIRGSRGGGTNPYMNDYEALAGLKTLADKYGIAVVVVHHCRKATAKDPLDLVSGTTGLTGAADAILILRRERTHADGALFVTGRDLAECDLAVRFDSTLGRWTVLGDASDLRLSPERRRIVDLLRRYNDSMSPTDIANAVGGENGAVRKLLGDMVKDGQILKTGRGAYTVQAIAKMQPDHPEACTDGAVMITGSNGNKAHIKPESQTSLAMEPVPATTDGKGCDGKHSPDQTLPPAGANVTDATHVPHPPPTLPVQGADQLTLTVAGGELPPEMREHLQRAVSGRAANTASYDMRGAMAAKLPVATAAPTNGGGGNTLHNGDRQSSLVQSPTNSPAEERTQADHGDHLEPGSIHEFLKDAAALNSQRPTIGGKPVFEIEAKTVISFNSGFEHKLLCDGLAFSAGSACVYFCAFCFVGPMMRKNPHLRGIDLPHHKIVVRRNRPVEIVRQQLTYRDGKPRFTDVNDRRVIYASPLVDVAATPELADETIEICKAILELTHWDIRLLSKSNLLPRIAKALGEDGRKRLIYGVSTGTLDDKLAAAFEGGTPPVSTRLATLHWLQEHGYRTFGMICPSLPQHDYQQFAHAMHTAIRADQCEHVWAEILNVRGDSMTRTVDALREAGYEWEADQVELVSQDRSTWEEYARSTFEAYAPLYPAGKLRYLQYVTKPTEDWWRGHVDRGAILL